MVGMREGREDRDGRGKGGRIGMGEGREGG